MNFKQLLPVICLIGAIFFLCYPKINSDRQKKQIELQNEIIEIQNKLHPVNDKYKNSEGIIDITVNYPPSLSYKSKKAIFDLRKQYVSNSLFNYEHYEPSDYVFGQIEGGKPWMSLDICESPDAQNHNITGLSEEGRFIANPSMLVAIEYPFYLTNSSDYNWCNGEEATMIPKNISYNPKTNEITVVYRSLPIIIQNNSFYTFNGVNARDLGYNYAYVDNDKSSYNLDFLNSENVSNQVVEFQNFIHLGSSCKHEGGCNNGSPRQPMLEFTYKSEKYTKQNAIIYIKLWHEKPYSPKEEADIVEKIILQKV